jgi:hypothetical protein
MQESSGHQRDHPDQVTYEYCAGMNIDDIPLNLGRELEINQCGHKDEDESGLDTSQLRSLSD